MINDIIWDTSLKETMNTTVEKDATANDISDESKDKKREILPRYYIFNTFSIFQIGSYNERVPGQISYFLFWNDRT